MKKVMQQWNDKKTQKRKIIAKMPRCVLMFASVTAEAISNIAYFVSINISYAMYAVNLVLPYLMYWMGLQGCDSKLILLIPMIVAITVFYIRGMLERTGKGPKFPVPAHRFTDVDVDGEVTVDKARLQELLLYVADVEDYLERKGML